MLIPYAYGEYNRAHQIELNQHEFGGQAHVLEDVVGFFVVITIQVVLQ